MEIQRLGEIGLLSGQRRPVMRRRHGVVQRELLDHAARLGRLGQAARNAIGRKPLRHRGAELIHVRLSPRNDFDVGSPLLLAPQFHPKSSKRCDEIRLGPLPEHQIGKEITENSVLTVVGRADAPCHRLVGVLQEGDGVARWIGDEQPLVVCGNRELLDERRRLEDRVPDVRPKHRLVHLRRRGLATACQRELESMTLDLTRPVQQVRKFPERGRSFEARGHVDGQPKLPTGRASVG